MMSIIFKFFRVEVPQSFGRCLGLAVKHGYQNKQFIDEK